MHYRLIPIVRDHLNIFSFLSSIYLLDKLEPRKGEYERLKCTIESPDHGVAGSAGGPRSPLPATRARRNVRACTLWYQLLTNSHSLLTDKVVALSKALDNELMSFSPFVDVANVV